MKLSGRAVPSASPVRHNGCHRFPKSNRQISTSPISSAFSGRYLFSLAAPLCHQISQAKSPQVLSHLLCSGRYSCFSHFTSFSCCVSRCASPLCLPGRRLQLLTVQPVLSSEALGRAVPSASPVRHNGCHRFPKSNRQISTNPISSAFSGRNFFSLAAPMCH